MELNKMNETELYELKLVETLVAKILGLHNSIKQLYNELKNIVQKEDGNQSFNLNKKLSSYWKLVAYRDCLSRLQLLLEQNFNYIEPMSLLAVTRYVFELTVWLKLMQKDEKYGYSYYYQLMDEKAKYFKKLQEYLNHDIQFLQEIALEELQLFEKQSREALEISDLELQEEALLQIDSNIEREIDNKASRKFSIYSEQA